MSTSFYTVTNAAGTILRSGSCPTDQVALQKQDSSEIVTTTSTITDPATTVATVTTPGGVPTITVAARTANGYVINKTTFTANGVDEVTITNVPSGALIDITSSNTNEIPNVIDTVADGSVIRITTDQAGAYTLRIDAPTLLPYEVVLNAN